MAMKVDPFEYVWVADASGFASGHIPLDGQGMNPLLQDYWMVIHPPVLFFGYASTVIPFALVIARLFRKKEGDFLKEIQPWAILSMFWLSLGIIMGGYWSYTTLGWGGYWAWDPVENASLVPFLLMAAYIHLLILEKKNGVLRRTNLLLGALPFPAVLYGSFLTRSGVLADFSVHSFIDQGINTFLILFLVVYSLLFAVIYGLKIKNITSVPLHTDFFTRESFLLYGTLIIFLFALLVFFGTSAPLFTSVFMSNPANVSPDYYNATGSLVTGLILVLAALTPLLPWKGSIKENLKIKIAGYTIISLILSAIIYFLGIYKPLSLVLISVSLFAVFLSVEFILKAGWSRIKNTGGFIAHTGLGLMAIGVVLSSMYDYSDRVAISPGEVKEALGYTILYKGIETGERGQDYAVLELAGHGDRFTANPKFYYSGYTRSYMTTPYVRNYFSHDLYVAPIQLLSGDDISPGKQLILQKGKIKKFGNLEISLTGFSMERDPATGMIIALSRLKVAANGDTTLLRPGIKINGNLRELMPDTLKTPLYFFTVTGINVDQQETTLTIATEEDIKNKADEYLVIEVSSKPWIWILWLGTILLFAGTLLAYRLRKSKTEQ
jgi:cytochrome c-type biogenesis protein CcmF